MKSNLKFCVFYFILIVSFSCNKLMSNKSTHTGFDFNNKKYGIFKKGSSKINQKTPLGMVFVEGGSFVMGQLNRYRAFRRAWSWAMCCR